MPVKHIPQRTCINCRTIRPKRELVRVIRVTENHLEIDPTGKKNGRGAYLCRQRICWDEILENPDRLTDALKMRAPLASDDVTVMRAFAAPLPLRLANGSDAPPKTN
ncbi:MAG: YlxR family protein [Chloroflexi bacterium]|nr:YlxR family protein [Chloroflexota bacterium]MBI3741548.1 YlxR family protein [Chloroflexota bacterium]